MMLKNKIENEMAPFRFVELMKQIENNNFSEMIKQQAKISSNEISEILVISSYPPRECGIATYSQDLIKALNNKFGNSLSIKVCALESNETNYSYPDEVKYVLKTSLEIGYEKLALTINNSAGIKIVLIQHEFAFFKKQEISFMNFLTKISKPIVVVFHTVLPHPNDKLKLSINNIAKASKSIIVMTHHSKDVLKNDYGLSSEIISVIPHGTHLVTHLSEKSLKKRYGLEGRKVLSTFGLLSSSKSIETTLEALPAIIKKCPEVIFLIIGKTHPEVVKSEGEKYRKSLEGKVVELKLSLHVKFINNYLDLPDLLEYLQLTDIYLFTSNDPNQAVSGTFAYAMSCACPIISTPIPHAKEVLTAETGVIIDFHSSEQLANSVINLLNDNNLRRNISSNTLQKIVSTAWENSAIAHANLFKELSQRKISFQYNYPAINLEHIKKMTTEIGIIQFSKINQADIASGYTLDDNARALIAACMHFKLKRDADSVNKIIIYFNFIKRCSQPSGSFLNYLDKDKQFTDQNYRENLDDSNGRAIWALGYLSSLNGQLPNEIILGAEDIIEKSLSHIATIRSTRALAFSIKGLYFYHHATKLPETISIVKTLASRLVEMYKHESVLGWEWYEPYLTYANSILPEAMLYACLLTGDSIYKEIALSSFRFLLLQTFNKNGIEVISNKNWLQKGEIAGSYGEQPIDVAYTIITLSKFYDVFKDDDYKQKMVTAFNWFLGKNRLHQIVYNPCTGGCYDGLEETHVNLNQGAESTVSYLIARLTMEDVKENTKEPSKTIEIRKQVKPYYDFKNFSYIKME